MKKPLLLATLIASVATSFVCAQQLPGTTPVTTGGPSVVPTLVTSAPGTFLAQASISNTTLTSFSPLLIMSATLQEAVFRNSNGGVDFYFQLQSPAPGQNSTDAIVQFLAANFGNYATNVGFRPDGTTLNAAGASGFKVGTVAATSAQRIAADSFGHNAITFGLAGLVGTANSVVLVVSTNASSFTSIGDYGFTPLSGPGNTVNGSDISLLSPSGTVVAPPAAAPEGGTTALLMIIGIAGLIAARRMTGSREVLVRS